jgi:hypothetical protein
LHGKCKSLKKPKKIKSAKEKGNKLDGCNVSVINYSR